MSSRSHIFTQKHITFILFVIGIITFWLLVFSVLINIAPPLIYKVTDITSGKDTHLEVIGYNFGKEATTASIFINDQEVEAYRILLWKNNRIRILHIPEDSPRMFFVVKSNRKTSNSKLFIMPSSYDETAGILDLILDNQEYYTYNQYEQYLFKDSVSLVNADVFHPFMPILFKKQHPELLGEWSITYQESSSRLFSYLAQTSSSIPSQYQKIYIPESVWFSITQPTSINIHEHTTKRDFDVTLHPLYAEFDLQTVRYLLKVHYATTPYHGAYLLPIRSTYQNSVLNVDTISHIDNNYFFSTDVTDVFNLVTIDITQYVTSALSNVKQNIVPVFYNDEPYLAYLFNQAPLSPQDINILTNIPNNNIDVVLSVPPVLTQSDTAQLFTLMDDATLLANMDTLSDTPSSRNNNDTTYQIMHRHIYNVILAFSDIELSVLRQLSFFDSILPFAEKGQSIELTRDILVAKYLRHHNIVARTIIGVELSLQTGKQVQEQYRSWIEVLTTTHGWIALQDITTPLPENDIGASSLYSIGKQNQFAGYVFEEYQYLLRNNQNPMFYNVTGFSIVQDN